MASPLERIARRLVRDVQGLRFPPPVAYVYDPLVYASAPFRTYLRRHGGGRKDVLFVGINPGPFGMCQTGIPFGDVAMVRDWIGIDGGTSVRRPAREHPKRPVLGFACGRSEVSGRRFWTWARERFGTADEFFARAFVWNWCPLCFVGAGGANLTPDRLPARARADLYAACDKALRSLVEVLRPRVVVGIGRFAQARARAALLDTTPPMPVEVARMPHPSPASPASNADGGRAWGRLADEALRAAGVEVPAGPTSRRPRPQPRAEPLSGPPSSRPRRRPRGGPSTS